MSISKKFPQKLPNIDNNKCLLSIKSPSCDTEDIFSNDAENSDLSFSTC